MEPQTMRILKDKVDWAHELTFVNNPTQTYLFGQSVIVAIKVQNKSSSPLLITSTNAWFDWQAEGQTYSENRNLVLPPSTGTPFLTAFELPQFQMVCPVPLDVSPGHHKFKFGVELSLWAENQWNQVEGVQWAKNAKPVSDRVLIAYPPPRSYHVFISHSEADKELTQRLVDQVKRIGQQPYVAESPQNPEIGKRLFEEKITGAIQRANIMVLLWTAKSSMSPAIRYEINYARQLNRRILVALESGMSLPAELQGYVYAPLGYENQTEALRLISRSLLQYEAEFQEQQRNSQAFVAILALLALAYFKS
jgi:hypothetical protein